MVDTIRPAASLLLSMALPWQWLACHRAAILVRRRLYPVFQDLPAAIGAGAVGAYLELVDWVNLPEGCTLGIALLRDPVHAGRVRRVEHQLTCDPHKQVLVGGRLDVGLSPRCGAVMRDHFYDDAGAEMIGRWPESTLWGGDAGSFLRRRRSTRPCWSLHPQPRCECRDSQGCQARCSHRLRSQLLPAGQ